jgi:hypothetical protein
MSTLHSRASFHRGIHLCLQVDQIDDISRARQNDREPVVLRRTFKPITADANKFAFAFPNIIFPVTLEDVAIDVTIDAKAAFLILNKAS